MYLLLLTLTSYSLDKSRNEICAQKLNELGITGKDESAGLRDASNRYRLSIKVAPGGQ